MSKVSESTKKQPAADLAEVPRQGMGLFTATMQLFELFLDNPAPAKRDKRAWDRLEQIAWEMHGHAAASCSGSPAHRLYCLRTVLSEARACFEELRKVEVAPLTLRALKHLDGVVGRVEKALDALPEVVMS